MVTIKQTYNPNGKPQTIAFIPAFIEDNPEGMRRDPGYIDRLMAREERTALALRYGRWDTFAGQIFREFVKAVHTCRPSDIPPHWSKWRAVDWGYSRHAGYSALAEKKERELWRWARIS